MKNNLTYLQDIANILRRDVLKMTSEAGSGHPSSCLSCAEIMACLFFHELSLDIKNPFNENNDEFILSKGHSAPILYSALYRINAIKEDLLSLRKFKSNLEGHPMPSLPFIKTATGSLGQGLSIGLGMAFAGKLDSRKYRVYVLMGDSESAEGSVYEAFEIASHYNLNNLTAIIDVNRLGQRGETILAHNINKYKKRFEGFGWNVVSVNGHNIHEILSAFKKTIKSKKPNLILAKTFKGKGVSFLENKNMWHGKALNNKELEKALKEIPDNKMPEIIVNKPKEIKVHYKIKKMNFTNYKIGEQTATREAYGNALANLAVSDNRVIALDAEVSNSTFSEKVKMKSKRQFIECFIAEQNMIGMALGLSKKGYKVYASSFSAFLTRAFDQLRMAAYSKGDFTCCGSHSGVSIGEDGVSQMGLEDISLFRSLMNSIVLYPSDAVSTEKLVYECSKLKGIKYIRTTRPKTPVIYNNNEKFELGDFKVLRESDKDKIVLIGAGITVSECLNAYEELKNNGINASVIDLYCIKPFNHKKFIDFVKDHGNKIVISEDHYKEGGIGEMIAGYLSETEIKIKNLAVNKLPHSGSKNELLEYEGIDWKSIVNEVKRLLS